MKEIFISYRHADSLAEAGRLYSELARRFGEDSVFLDQSGIQSGDDFPEALCRAVDGAEVFLAVIGPARVQGHPSAGARGDDAERLCGPTGKDTRTGDAGSRDTPRSGR